MGDFDYTIKSIEIKICGDYYNERKTQKKLYKKVHPEGITTVVEYVDTKYDLMEEDAETAPIVLCLHGAPGSHHDFTQLIKYLKQRKVRVIVPNFPDYCITEKTKVFRHSAEEKAEYIKDFLKHINVSRIDLLVSHSSAIYPSTLLWQTASAPEIKSIALINPAGHRRLKFLKPKIFFDNAVRIYRNKYGRVLYRTFGPTVLSITGCVVKHNNMDNVILSATTMIHANPKTLSKRLEAMKERALPVLFAFSDQDKLVEYELFLEMSAIIGIDEDSIEIYDENASLIQSSKNSGYPKAILLKGGGHYWFTKYPSVINEAIYAMLKFIRESED
ncbi:DUF1057 domain containing protein-like protein [Dinothrombium tinctorium]|uniref:DUF1057 domain containing protein-like protein n=1 Tax=Dinothrombium tinctorium TaxID=1965070 RepID=A0A3S3NZN4_9ACAR|nr:DUF1057 domain containing protein-like protein [Dinothrombium tinctorium]